MRQSIKKRIFLLPVLFLFTAAVLLSSCGSKKEPVVRNGFYFDTVITITLYGESERLSPLFDDIFALCEHYDALFDRTAPGSDIAKINDAAGTPVTVHPETLSLIRTACSYAELTGGLIDPTITPLLLLWGFGNDAASAGSADSEVNEGSSDSEVNEGSSDSEVNEDSADSEVNEDSSGSGTQSAPGQTSLTLPPDTDALTSVCTHIDYRSIVIDEQAETVMLTDPDAAIDLGFIAKGYIADRIRDYLVSKNVTSAIINLGGNILCIGSRPDKNPFRVAVQYPFGQTGDMITTLSIRDQSVVTSGVYERFVEADGVRYHHILDPRTGYPAENNLLSVTIITDSSTDADALSTACFLLGLSDGMALIESLSDTEALFITDDYELHYSSGLR